MSLTWYSAIRLASFLYFDRLVYLGVWFCCHGLKQLVEVWPVALRVPPRLVQWWQSFAVLCVIHYRTGRNLELKCQLAHKTLLNHCSHQQALKNSVERVNPCSQNHDYNLCLSGWNQTNHWYSDKEYFELISSSSSSHHQDFCSLVNKCMVDKAQTIQWPKGV